MHRNTISAWERGEYLPETTELIRGIADILSLNAKDKQRLLESTRERITLRPIWYVPYQRNPYFTGREEILLSLHHTLISGATAALIQTHAISGLGGIGKTQVAVEYAYRFRQDYHAVIWLKADTREIFFTNCLEVAQELKLPERNVLTNPKSLRQ